MAAFLSDVGESSLIERIRARLPAGEGVLVGPGDDAAAVRTGPATLVSTDLLAEGVHFDLRLCTPADLGFKALAVNVSDIAAMGGLARYGVVSLGAPPETPVGTIDALYDGLVGAGERYKVAIVGGDLSAAPALLVSIGVLGEPAPEGLVTRSGARVGDLLCVTGALGASAAGLELLRAGAVPDARALSERFPGLAAAYRRPTPRAEAGPAVAGLVTAMIDVSDGLARDAGHIATESRLGVRVRADALPLASGLQEAAAMFGRNPNMWALAGGEDYELAMAVPPPRLAEVEAAVAPLALSVVGEFTAEPSVLVLGGEESPLGERGWDHFSRAGP